MELGKNVQVLRFVGESFVINFCTKWDFQITSDLSDSVLSPCRLVTAGAKLETRDKT